MKIRLDEITSEGKEFDFDEKSGELSGSFADLSLAGYEIHAVIKPLDAYFELRGQAVAKVADLCGKCGFDIDVPVTREFNDMILEKPKEPRGSQYSKGSSVSSSRSGDHEVVYHEGGVFNLGEYLHEVLALEIPSHPSCGIVDCPRALEMEARLQKINEESSSFAEDNRRNNPFDSLKNLKLQ